MIKELAIISGKGGCGKTSITLALSSLFENKLMVDCDVDACDMHLILNPETLKKHDFHAGKKAVIDRFKCTKCGICKDICVFNAITDETTVNEYFCEGCGACKLKCPVNAVNLIPQKSGEWYESRTRLGRLIHARLDIGEENSGKLVSEIKTHARTTAYGHDIPLIIMDGAPGIGCPVIASIAGVDLVLIVIEPSLSGLHDAKRVVELAKHFNISPVACINKYDINIQISKSIEMYLNENKIELLGKIPYSNDFVSAMINNKTLIEYDKNSDVSKEIIKIKKRLERILDEEQ